MRPVSGLDKKEVEIGEAKSPISVIQTSPGKTALAGAVCIYNGTVLIEPVV
jgi:hypothetical protein